MAVRFKTGESVPDSGIYRVLHAEHRLPHEVTLIKGYGFPRCQKCTNLVEFEAVLLAEDWQKRKAGIHIVLYELPVLADADSEGAA